MIQLLPICLINPGTDRTMCTKMRKNANFTDLPALITCPRCLGHYVRNVLWYADKLEREKIFEENLELYKKEAETPLRSAYEPIGKIKKVIETDAGLEVQFELNPIAGYTPPSVLFDEWTQQRERNAFSKPLSPPPPSMTPKGDGGQPKAE